MAHNRSPSPEAPPGAISFEVADLADARRSLDELPAGVAELAKSAPNYWEQRRRKPQPEDRALTGATIDWLLALPPNLRPQALCERYPRVANMIATAWPHIEERRSLLHSLLRDARGGRKGFPAGVRREIEVLHGSLSTPDGSGDS
jgi:hypothetical protein